MKQAPLPTPLSGPDFGSYDAREVSWLLTDLSDVELEAPVEDREEAIQAGTAHYSESLPVEYHPSPEYTELFHHLLAESARALARAVGAVTELVLATRGPQVVLVSLARAGTPAGVLMRRWARAVGVEPAHHTMSIIRGRGIDRVALRWLAEHHDPRDVVFVDGWTGKGAISRQLTACVEEANAELGTAFSADLAVIADPGGCADLYGTRKDLLIASACLNSTVSGLVSRTVLNEQWIGPGDFHGAKFYAGLADADVSRLFLDAVTDRFDDVGDEVARDLVDLLATDRTRTWSGWAEVERIAARHAITDLNLVKPGVGETTRVLLRRVPWQILVRPGAVDRLGHLRLLAEQRGVPLVEVADLGFDCVGLIRPVGPT